MEVGTGTSDAEEEGLGEPDLVFEWGKDAVGDVGTVEVDGCVEVGVGTCVAEEERLGESDLVFEWGKDADGDVDGAEVVTCAEVVTDEDTAD